MTESKPEIVELIPAFVWDCPNCGREKFERAIVTEFDKEDRERMMLELGMDPGESGDWMLAPESVTCPSCGNKFETKHFRDEDGER